MNDPSMFQQMFEEIETLISKEAEGFSQVVETMANFSSAASGSTAAQAFTAAGSVLMTLFFCMEAFTFCAAIDFNGGIEGALKVAMKLVVCQLIIQNTGNITGIITGLFKNAAMSSYSEAFTAIGTSFSNAASAENMEGGIMDINFLCLSIILLVVAILLFVLFTMIVITMLGVIIETGILTAISPVALSTLVNSQARSTGISFIKNFAAVSMQWGVLTVCFEVYKEVSNGLQLQFFEFDSGGLLIHIMQYATPLLCVIMLAVSVNKASEITKRALGG